VHRHGRKKHFDLLVEKKLFGVRTCGTQPGKGEVFSLYLKPIILFNPFNERLQPFEIGRVDTPTSPAN
jgi:hypothetical protein